MSKYMLFVFLVVILAIVIMETQGEPRRKRRTSIHVREVRKFRVKIRYRRGKRSIGSEMEVRHLPCDFDCLDKNKDGSVNHKELEYVLEKRVPKFLLPEAIKLVFEAIDLNGDNLLFQDEFDEYYDQKQHCILDDLVLQPSQA